MASKFQASFTEKLLVLLLEMDKRRETKDLGELREEAFGYIGFQYSMKTFRWKSGAEIPATNQQRTEVEVKAAEQFWHRATQFSHKRQKLRDFQETENREEGMCGLTLRTCLHLSRTFSKWDAFGGIF